MHFDSQDWKDSEWGVWGEAGGHVLGQAVSFQFLSHKYCCDLPPSRFLFCD